MAKAYNVANAGRVRDRVLRKKYGISAEQFDGMLQQQGSRCAICQTDQPNGKYNVFHVDHCHDTARVRGLLCYECNVGLGKFGDSVDRLSRAIDYLNKAREAQ